jgi:hypothetical protein
MGNSSNKHWKSKESDLVLDPNSKNYRYNILKIPRNKSGKFFTNKDGEISEIDYIDAINLFTSHMFLSNSIIIPTLKTLKDYFPQTYSLVKKAYEQKLGYVKQTATAFSKYYSGGTVYVGYEEFNNTQPFDQIDETCYFLYCSALKEEIQNTLDQEHIKQQEELQKLYKPPQTKISKETKENINKIKEKFKKTKED